jgi:hypothetical protein
MLATWVLTVLSEMNSSAPVSRIRAAAGDGPDNLGLSFGERDGGLGGGHGPAPGESLQQPRRRGRYPAPPAQQGSRAHDKTGHAVKPPGAVRGGQVVCLSGQDDGEHRAKARVGDGCAPPGQAIEHGHIAQGYAGSRR